MYLADKVPLMISRMRVVTDQQLMMMRHLVSPVDRSENWRSCSPRAPPLPVLHMKPVMSTARRVDEEPHALNALYIMFRLVPRN